MFKEKKTFYVLTCTCVSVDKTQNKKLLKEFHIESKIFSLTFTYTEKSIPSLTVYSSGVILNTAKSEGSKQIDFPKNTKNKILEYSL